MSCVLLPHISWRFSYISHFFRFLSLSPFDFKDIIVRSSIGDLSIWSILSSSVAPKALKYSSSRRSLFQFHIAYTPHSLVVDFMLRFLIQLAASAGPASCACVCPAILVAYVTVTAGLNAKTPIPYLPQRPAIV